MSPDGLANYLMHFAQENLIPHLKNPTIPISDLLSKDQETLLNDYIVWKAYFNCKLSNEWLEGGNVTQNDRSQFNEVLKDFLAISYSVGVIYEKPGQYKPLFEALAEVKNKKDSLDLEGLIVDTIGSEIIEEENILNFARFGELIDYIKNPKNLENIKDLLYTQTSDLVMEDSDNALKLAEILKSLKLLAEKVDYEIVQDLVDKYIKVCEYSHKVHIGENPVYKFFEETIESELKDSLGLLLDFPFDTENKEKFDSLCSHYNPVKFEEPAKPVEVNPIIEEFKKILYKSPEWESNDVEFIDSADKIIFKGPIYHGEKENLKLQKGEIKDRNGKIIHVAIKSSIYEKKQGTMEFEYMVRAQDHKSFLKVYGFYQDKSINGLLTNNIVMELARKSLNNLIAEWEEEGFDLKQRKLLALQYAKDLIFGMYTLTKKNIHHLDLKPDNILISLEDLLKIVDFGVSKEIKRDEYGFTMNTISGKFAGTGLFMSPEMKKIMKGEALEINYNISDVYSLGLTILRMITKNIHADLDDENLLQTVIWGYIDKAFQEIDRPEDFKEDILEDYEKKLRNLLRKMLTVNRKDRLGFQDLCGFFNESILTEKPEFQ